MGRTLNTDKIVSMNERSFCLYSLIYHLCLKTAKYFLFLPLFFRIMHSKHRCQKVRTNITYTSVFWKTIGFSAKWRLNYHAVVELVEISTRGLSDGGVMPAADRGAHVRHKSDQPVDQRHRWSLPGVPRQLQPLPELNVLCNLVIADGKPLQLNAQNHRRPFQRELLRRRNLKCTQTFMQQTNLLNE